MFIQGDLVRGRDSFMKKSKKFLIVFLVLFLFCFLLETGTVIYYLSQIMGFESVMTYFNEDKLQYILAMARYALVDSLTILSIYALFSLIKKNKKKVAD